MQLNKNSFCLSISSYLQGYFGVEGIPVVWTPSAGFNYGNLNVGPQKEGKYKVVVMVRTGGGFNTSESTIITVK